VHVGAAFALHVTVLNISMSHYKEISLL
jgi:hypothetical protein